MIDLNRLDLVSHPVILHLLQRMWRTCARNVFQRELLFQCWIVFLWTMSTVVLGPLIEVSAESSYDLYGGMRQRIHRGGLVHAMFIWVFLISTASLVLREVVFLISVYGLNILTGLRARDAWFVYDMATYAFAVISLSICHIMSFAEHSSIVDFVRHSSSIIAILLWIRFLQFLTFHSKTGPFVKIIGKMMGDLLNFFLVYLVFVLAFGNAFFLLLSPDPDAPPVVGDGDGDGVRAALAHTFLRATKKGTTTSSSSDEQAFEQLETTLLAVFRLMVGDYSYEAMQDSEHLGMATFLYVAYVLVAALLLLNLLIAMLNETYSKVKEDSTREWRVEWGRRMLAMQQRQGKTNREDIANDEEELMEECPDEEEAPMSEVATQKSVDSLAVTLERIMQRLDALEAAQGTPSKETVVLLHNN